MRFRSFLLLTSARCAAAFFAFGAHAATLTVAVTDSAGRPLSDAVVMLEPASGKLAVKPMTMVEIAQAKSQFNPRVTVITVGTAVNFPNYDTIRHQVYSFSPIKTFELKLYAGVPTSPLVFDKPGIAVLGCNIHDQMAAWVVVVDTPHHARSSALGQARLDGIAAGRYQLRVWHSNMAHAQEPVSQPLTVAATDLGATVQVPVSAP